MNNKKDGLKKSSMKGWPNKKTFKWLQSCSGCHDVKVGHFPLKLCALLKGDTHTHDHIIYQQGVSTTRGRESATFHRTTSDFSFPCCNWVHTRTHTYKCIIPKRPGGSGGRCQFHISSPAREWCSDLWRSQQKEYLWTQISTQECFCSTLYFSYHAVT